MQFSNLTEMTSKDLMIGDWVKLPQMLADYSPARVEEINDKGCIADGWPLLNDEIQPVPLTPEILEKNGFERTTCGVGSIIYTFSDDDEYYAFAIDEYTDSIWRVEYTNCEMSFPLVRIMVLFVHEFQHALRLCGIDKDIEL